MQIKAEVFGQTKRLVGVMVGDNKYYYLDKQKITRKWQQTKLYLRYAMCQKYGNIKS